MTYLIVPNKAMKCTRLRNLKNVLLNRRVYYKEQVLIQIEINHWNHLNLKILVMWKVNILREQIKNRKNLRKHFK